MILQIDVNNPNEARKDKLWQIAKDLNKEFLLLNNIPLIPMEIDNKTDYNGYYNPNQQTVYVNLKRSRVPVKTPQFQWSYPGYKADLTCVGILSHEIGHYIHYYKGVKPLAKIWKEKTKGESAITRYDKGNNIGESIAEAFKLFINNPDLLKQGRPKKYNLIIEEFGMKPLHEESWKEIFKYASSRFIQAGENWIKS